MLIENQTSTAESSKRTETGSGYQTFAVAFCFLFGVAFILNIHPICDGQWFWYAKLLLQGHRLYAEMHLVLQPLFVLGTSLNMLLLGEGWLVSKLPAFLALIAFLIGLRLLASFSPLEDWRKAILIGSAFFLPILFVAYRFDDYHVWADCFEVYSIVLILFFLKQGSPERYTSATYGSTGHSFWPVYYHTAERRRNASPYSLAGHFCSAEPTALVCLCSVSCDCSNYRPYCRQHDW